MQSKADRDRARQKASLRKKQAEKDFTRNTTDTLGDTSKGAYLPPIKGTWGVVESNKTN